MGTPVRLVPIACPHFARRIESHDEQRMGTQSMLHQIPYGRGSTSPVEATIHYDALITIDIAKCS